MAQEMFDSARDRSSVCSAFLGGPHPMPSTGGLGRTMQCDSRVEDEVLGLP